MIVFIKNNKGRNDVNDYDSESRLNLLLNSVSFQNCVADRYAFNARIDTLKRCSTYVS